MEEETRVLDTVLGVDLGTTSVKCSLIDLNSHGVLYTYSQPTAAGVSGASVENIPLANEQDVKAIFQTIRSCFKETSNFCSTSNIVQRVKRVGVTGQMHGMVLWKSGLKFEDLTTDGADDRTTNDENQPPRVSHLYTWQDGRCTPEFLASLPSPNSHLKLATGHGCASLFWLQRNMPEFLQGFDHAGTIMDLFVSLLCELDAPVMSVQNAASWGYFNCETNTWNKEMLCKAGFPVDLLPEVRPPGSVAGKTTPLASRMSADVIPAGVAVGVGMGDLPCTMLPVLESQHDGVISISTSAQIVMTTPSGFAPPPSNPASPIEYFPYFDGTFLSVAAALTGGNVLASLVTMLQDWQQGLGLPAFTDENAVFKTLIELGLKCKNTTLEINPLLGGERHLPDQRGTVSGASFDNLSLGDVFRASCRGIAANLNKMSPPGDMKTSGVTRLVGCGSALLRNPVLKQEVEGAFSVLPMVYSEKGDAALGAALAMCRD